MNKHLLAAKAALEVLLDGSTLQVLDRGVASARPKPIKHLHRYYVHGYDWWVKHATGHRTESGNGNTKEAAILDFIQKVSGGEMCYLYNSGKFGKPVAIPIEIYNLAILGDSK
jgi:hypothetical protein